MINKGQKKRVLSESDGIGKSQDSNKNVQPSKKIKNIKQEPGAGAEVQKNIVKKVVKSKTEGAVQNQSLPLSQQTAKKAKELKGKKMVLVNSEKVNLNYKLIKEEAKEDTSVGKQAKKSVKKGQKEKGGQKVANGKLSLEERIAEIQSRENLTKSSKRKLGILKKKLAIEKGIPIPQREVVPKSTSGMTKSQARKLRRQKSVERRSQNDTESDATIKSKNVVKPGDIQKSKKKTPQPGDESAVKQTQHKNVKTLGPVKSEPIQKQLGKGATKVVQENKQNGKNKVQIMKQSKGGNKNQLVKKGSLPGIKIKKEIKEETDDSEDEDEDDDEDEDEDEDANNTLNSSLNTSDNDDDEDEEEDDDEEEEEEEEDDDEDEEVQAKKPRQEQSIKKAANAQNLDSPEKKKRYVLFVGNLPYDVTTDDIKKHFLTKVSEVVSVRIPTKPGSNTPRGIGYVEVTNDKDYEKGLSFHNTVLNGRRLNVEYTKTGSKNVRNNSDVVAKNKKLHALRKAGVLAGSQKHDQKRSVRRAKHIKAN